MRLYHDPHHKPDRTAAKYRADQNRDVKSAADNRQFVAEFLHNWKRSESKRDPAEVFQALRSEAKRDRFARSGKQSAGTKKKKASSSAKKQTKHDKLASGKRAHSLQERSVSKRRLRAEPSATDRIFHKSRFVLDSSQRYLKLSDIELLHEYEMVQDKIDLWGERFDSELDEKKKGQLGQQIQVQYSKRRDLIALINFRVDEPGE